MRRTGSREEDLIALFNAIAIEQSQLAGDGLRYYDLQRWHAGNLLSNPETILGMKLLPSMRAQYTTNISNMTVNSDYYLTPYGTLTRTGNDKLYLYPIPLQELTLNPALKPQNRGWQ